MPQNIRARPTNASKSNKESLKKIAFGKTAENSLGSKKKTTLSAVIPVSPSTTKSGLVNFMAKSMLIDSSKITVISPK